MNFCNRCVDELSKATSFEKISQLFVSYHVEIVPESECEFWAHRLLNLEEGFRSEAVG